MSVLVIILGILMIIGGVVCLTTPISTTLGLMYFIMILFFSAGVIYLIRSIILRRFMDFVFTAISLIAGGFIIFKPNMTFITDLILLYIAASWLIIRGVIGVIESFRVKGMVSGALFALGVIISLLLIAAGIYSLTNPAMFAAVLGKLISCYFIVEGIDIVVTGCIGRDIEKQLTTDQT